MHPFSTTATKVGPNFDAIGGSDKFAALIGALMTYGLIIAVLMLLVCAAMWALGSAQGSWQVASKAKTGVLVALGGAAITGGAVAWANWLLATGSRL